MKKVTSFFIFLVFIGCFSFGLPSARAYDATLRRALDLAYNAQFDAAVSQANGYINGHPADPLGYIIRGTVLDWKQAVLNLRKKLDGQVLADFQKANELAFHLWEKDQDNIDKMVNLGNSYMFLAKKWLDMGKKSRSGLVLKKCRKHMEKAIAKDPNRWDAYLAIGIFNFYAANIPPGLQLIASLLGISGNEQLGLNQLKQVADNDNLFQPHALFILSYAYGHTKKNYAAAQTYLNKLIALYSNNPSFLVLSGEYAFRGKQFAQSRQAFDRLFAFCGGGRCAQVYLFLAHYFITAGYVEEKNFAAAKSSLEQADKLNENQFADRTVRIHYYRGMILKAEGKIDAAVAEFYKVKEMKDKNDTAWKLAKKELEALGKNVN